jgi:hypothetical protein
LTQGASLRQYIGAGIPMFESFVHSFISLSPSLNYLCPFPLSISIFLPNLISLHVAANENDLKRGSLAFATFRLLIENTTIISFALLGGNEN